MGCLLWRNQERRRYLAVGETDAQPVNIKNHWLPFEALLPLTSAEDIPH
jgi:hypothetical protein